MQREATSALVETYRLAAITHRAETKPRKVNQAADRIAAVYRELRERGERSALLVLLSDEYLGVRAWAGAHALEFRPELGEPVLEQIVADDEPAIDAFNAAMTLQEWRSGRLRFP